MSGRRPPSERSSQAHSAWKGDKRECCSTNTPAHSSTVDMAAIQKCGFQLVEDPPYSPDMAPSDYYLFLKGRGDDVMNAVDHFPRAQQQQNNNNNNNTNNKQTNHFFFFSFFFFFFTKIQKLNKNKNPTNITYFGLYVVPVY